MEIKKTLGPVEVQPSGHIWVRVDSAIVDETGNIIGYPTNRHWRGVVEPGDYAEAERLGVSAIATAAWTPEVLEAWANRPTEVI